VKKSLSRFFQKPATAQTEKNVSVRERIPSAEWLFAKILIAFARYTRCRRNNENYDKLRNLWCCSVCELTAAAAATDVVLNRQSQQQQHSARQHSVDEGKGLKFP
jgi:hypothetical protein